MQPTTCVATPEVENILATHVLVIMNPPHSVSCVRTSIGFTLVAAPQLSIKSGSRSALRKSLAINSLMSAHVKVHSGVTTVAVSGHIQSPDSTGGSLFSTVNSPQHETSVIMLRTDTTKLPGSVN